MDIIDVQGHMAPETSHTRNIQIDASGNLERRLADEDLKRDWPLATPLYAFLLDEVRQELGSICEEVEETCKTDDNVRAVPESAYVETIPLLEQMHGNIPMPDVMWLEDGGIGLEWRPEDGIVTMSLYGDNHVTGVAILGGQREIAGTCLLSDDIILPAFLEILRSLYPIEDVI